MESKPDVRVFVATLFALALAIAAPLAFYAISFHGHPWVSDNPLELGPFGDFFGGIANPLLGAINVFLVAYIAVALRRANSREESDNQRTMRILDFKREWESNEVYIHRTNAQQLLRTCPTHSLEELYERFPKEMHPVWVVLGFFSTIQFAIDKGLLNKDDVAEVFGQVFTWWDIVCIRDGYPVKWDSSRRLARLQQVIREVAVSRGLPLALWEQRAHDELRKYPRPTTGVSSSPTDEERRAIAHRLLQLDEPISGPSPSPDDSVRP